MRARSQRSQQSIGAQTQDSGHQELGDSLFMSIPSIHSCAPQDSDDEGKAIHSTDVGMYTQLQSYCLVK